MPLRHPAATFASPMSSATFCSSVLSLVSFTCNVNEHRVNETLVELHMQANP